MNDYRLLPDGMTVEEVQMLVTAGYHNNKIKNLLEKKVGKDQSSFKNSNFFCLISGDTSETQFIGIGDRAYYTVYGSVLLLWLFVEIILGIPAVFLTILGELLSRFRPNILAPPTFCGLMTFGNTHKIFGDVIEHNPANGWIWTQGLTGVKSWNGTFVGKIRNLKELNINPESIIHHVGATCFSGIRIHWD